MQIQRSVWHADSTLCLSIVVVIVTLDGLLCWMSTAWLVLAPGRLVSHDQLLCTVLIMEMSTQIVSETTYDLWIVVEGGGEEWRMNVLGSGSGRDEKSSWGFVLSILGCPLMCVDEGRSLTMGCVMTCKRSYCFRLRISEPFTVQCTSIK